MPKPQYAPVPVAAIGDARLTRRYWQVLAAVASHDRFGNNGMGCTASLARLSQDTGLHKPDVSNALNNLARWGYLERRKNPLDARGRSHHVNYETTAKVSGDGNVSDRATAKNVSASTNKIVSNIGKKVSAVSDEIITDQALTDCNILSKNRELNRSCEAAPLTRPEDLIENLIGVKEIPPNAEIDRAGNTQPAKQNGPTFNGTDFYRPKRPERPSKTPFEAILHQTSLLGIKRDLAAQVLLEMSPEEYVEISSALSAGEYSNADLLERLARIAKDGEQDKANSKEDESNAKEGE